MPTTTRTKKERPGVKRGPPGKKNDAMIERILVTAPLGLPMSIVAGRCGITRETLGQWRAADAELDRKNAGDQRHRPRQENGS
jgi:hypothetical protein